MHPWFLQPFPVPFPAPSLIGLMTTNAILLLVLLFLGLFIQPLRVVTGHKLYNRFPYQWFLICGFATCAGLDTLHIWGTLTELPIGFVWSVVYIAALFALRLALLPFVKKQSTIEHHRF